MKENPVWVAIWGELEKAFEERKGKEKANGQ